MLYAQNRDLDPVKSTRERGNVRTVQSAQIDGRDFTVAKYDGYKAQKEWKRHVKDHMGIRHANVLQIFGIVEGQNVYAAVFHGDLVPVDNFLHAYRQYPLKFCYIHSSLATDYFEGGCYLYHNFRYDLNRNNSTLLVNHLTGHLCLDPVGNTRHHLCSFRAPLNIDKSLQPPPMQVLSAPDSNLIVELFDFSDYHVTCYIVLSTRRAMPIATTATLHVGSVLYYGNSELDDPIVVAFRPATDWKHLLMGYWRHDTPTRPLKELSRDWTHRTQFSYRQLIEQTELGNGLPTNLVMELMDRVLRSDDWLSQANHIFRRSSISSNRGDYWLLDSIKFRCHLHPVKNATSHRPEGFLILCPPEDFRATLSGLPEAKQPPEGYRAALASSFKWPETPAYWSLDYWGSSRLSTEEAAQLGFPSIHFSTELQLLSWDDSVYAGIREFHCAKGCGPESQEIAKGLDRPLYELASEREWVTVLMVKDIEDRERNSGLEDVDDEFGSHKDNSETARILGVIVMLMILFNIYHSI
ncbi:hypothetical protein R3P38DRAFT_3037816 [Favolaschia claudopus]|uniref:Uncharacterized protein n=1 Tax=Favolaschia claudopus TaxID=2862362 RepID=A0AAW0ABW9_9AGAR